MICWYKMQIYLFPKKEINEQSHRCALNSCLMQCIDKLICCRFLTLQCKAAIRHSNCPVVTRGYIRVTVKINVLSSCKHEPWCYDVEYNRWSLTTTINVIAFWCFFCWKQLRYSVVKHTTNGANILPCSYDICVLCVSKSKQWLHFDWSVESIVSANLRFSIGECYLSVHRTMIVE